MKIIFQGKIAFEVIERIGPITYQLGLPSHLAHTWCIPCIIASKSGARSHKGIATSANRYLRRFDYRSATSEDFESQCKGIKKQEGSFGENLMEEILNWRRNVGKRV
jgi:hypothetical protein